MSFLLAYALTVLPGCVADLPQTVGPSGPIAAVTVTIDSITLLVGHSARASAIAQDTAGNRLSVQTVSWKSLIPTVATISSDGVATAVTSGSALIQGTISGTTGLGTMVVVVPPNLASHNFDDGTKGPYTKWSDMDFPDDPTGSGRGKVSRIPYAPTAANVSADRYLNYRTFDAGRLRYGRTIWMRGDFYIPYAGSAHKAAGTRKLIDYSGQSDDGWTGAGVRMVISRRESDTYSGRNVLNLSAVDYMGTGIGNETVYQETGIEILDDTWYAIEVKMVTNSADNARDGVLEIYMNGEATPSYRRSTGLGWITEAFVENGPGGVPRVGSYFSDFRIGFQLTVNYPTDPLYTEYRYWDNVAFSTTRIGR